MESTKLLLVFFMCIAFSEARFGPKLVSRIKTILKQPCPYGFREFDGCCYFFSQRAVTHEKAVFICRYKNAYLVEPKDSMLNKFLIQGSDPKSEYWTGVDNYAVPGKWIYEQKQQPVLPGYTNWAPGHPNKNNLNQCMSYNKKGMWVDRPCTQQHLFVCEAARCVRQSYVGLIKTNIDDTYGADPDPNAAPAPADNENDKVDDTKRPRRTRADDSFEGYEDFLSTNAYPYSMYNFRKRGIGYVDYKRIVRDNRNGNVGTDFSHWSVASSKSNADGLENKNSAMLGYLREKLHSEFLIKMKELELRKQELDLEREKFELEKKERLKKLDMFETKEREKEYWRY